MNGFLQVLADGSYSIGPRELSDSDASVRFEHCLVGDDPESRMRVVVTLKRLGEEAAWKLLNTEVRAGPPRHAQADRYVRCLLAP